MKHANNSRKPWVWITAATSALALIAFGGALWIWYTAEAESASVIGTPYFGAGETKDQAASTAAAATVSTAPEDAVSSSEGVDVSETSAITEATVSSAAPDVTKPAPTKRPTQVIPPQITEPVKPTEPTAAPPKITYEQYMKETYFIGDSRTNRMVMYGYVSNTRAFALNGINHSDARNNRFVNLGDGKRYTMAEAVGIKKPVRMVVSLGINGIGFMSESGFFSTYEDFLNGLRQASPDTALVVQAILPVSAVYEKAKPSMANEKINRYNEKLREITEACGGHFLDTSAVLKDETGALASEYDSGDGLHYNKTAYKVLFQYIEEHLDEAM